MNSKIFSVLMFILGFNFGIISVLMYTDNFQNFYHNVMNHFVCKNNSNDEIENLEENNIESQDSIKKIKLVCWIPTYPSNYEKALHVKATWGKRCNKIIFMGSSNGNS